LDWSPDASRLLVASAEGVCREFGIVSQHVLQEYLGHTSCIHSCRYLSHGTVVTCSADGTVRLWKQGQCFQILQPQGAAPATVGSSVVVDTTTILTESPAILTISEIPGAPNQLLMVPRAPVAYLVDVVGGTVLQSYSVSAPDAVFCAATVTVDWVYLCTTAQDCLVFEIKTGRLETTIRDFGVESTSKTTTTDRQTAEISQLAHHPFKPMLAAFSNDKTQKKGVLTVWK
jgi:WD40 repeat protein